MGWLVVMFDLPVLTKPQRKVATRFRKFLLDDGYVMVQFSVYARPCVTHEKQEKHAARVRRVLPSGGNVRMLFITDHQWKGAITLIGHDTPIGPPPEEMPDQMEFW